jgi:nicotinate-nucleotide pyrophosphorylase
LLEGTKILDTRKQRQDLEHAKNGSEISGGENHRFALMI